jgi:hypothetical protein
MGVLLVVVQIQNGCGLRSCTHRLQGVVVPLRVGIGSGNEVECQAEHLSHCIPLPPASCLRSETTIEQHLPSASCALPADESRRWIPAPLTRQRCTTRRGSTHCRPKAQRMWGLHVLNVPAGHGQPHQQLPWKIADRC